MGALFQGLVRFAPSLEEDETRQRFSDLFSDHEPLTRRLLIAARNPCSNPMQRPVQDLQEALSALGLKVVKQLALTLIQAEADLFLCGERPVTARLELCFLSALLARDIVARQGSCDGELGFVCALLRNWGRLVQGGLIEPDPPRALEEALMLQDDETSVAVFGMAPAELSYHLWRLRRLPPALLGQLQQQPPYRITTTAFTHEDELLMWSDLSLRLAHLLCASSSPGRLTGLAVQSVLEREAATHGLGGEEVLVLMKKALGELTQIFHPALIRGAAPVLDGAFSDMPLSDLRGRPSAGDLSRREAGASFSDY